MLTLAGRITYRPPTGELRLLQAPKGSTLPLAELSTYRSGGFEVGGRPPSVPKPVGCALLPQPMGGLAVHLVNVG